MATEFNRYDTRALLGVMEHKDPLPSFWRSLGFPRTFQADKQWIEFEKIATYRKIAPFVMPAVQGSPIFTERSDIYQFAPAYIKVKDPVHALEQGGRMVGHMLDLVPPTPAQNYAANVAKIALAHREAIENRWELMCARALLDGKVLIEGDGYPPVLVDWGRDAGHTITLGSGARWGDSGVSPLANLETWRDLMGTKPFAGTVKKVIMGKDVWPVFRASADVEKTLDLNIRGTKGTVDITTPGEGKELEYKGSIGSFEFWVYRGFYHNNAGTRVDIMNSKDVALIGDNVDGALAFGAILDKQAQWKALPIFPKMWDQEDPSATFILSQSAPLPVVVNPNNTLKARVLA
jgi:hypothetical protein